MQPASSVRVQQLIAENEPPLNGKRSSVVVEDPRLKVVLFAFAAGSGLTEHTAPYPAILQVISGKATITVEADSYDCPVGTWIQLPAGTRHSISAQIPTLLLLTLLKGHS